MQGTGCMDAFDLDFRAVLEISTLEACKKSDMSNSIKKKSW